MATVCAYVHVQSEDGVKTAVLAPGDTVPEWAEVTNPAALTDEADKSEDDEPAKRAPRRKATTPAE